MPVRSPRAVQPPSPTNLQADPGPGATSPGAPGPRVDDRTGVVVGLGLLVLLTIGVVSVFGETLLGLGSSETTAASKQP